MIKFFWGLIIGAFLGGIITMWYIKGQLQNAASQEITVNNEVPAGFLNFYEKFHKDSLYQIEHVVFPLQGLPAYADSATFANKSFRFEKDDWVMHKSFNDQDGQFVRSFNKLGEGLMVEQIKNAEQGVGMQRRFAKRGEEWYLIYYAQINFMGQ